MNRFFCRKIFILLTIAMLALCMLAMMSACQSKKELDLNNYNEYLIVKQSSENGGGLISIIDTLIITKVSEDYKFSDVKIKYRYKMNDYEGEVSEDLEDLTSTYRKEIRVTAIYEHYIRYNMEITVLEISGRVRSVNRLGTGLVFLCIPLAAFGILGLVAARGIRLSHKFEKINIGMTYQETVKIVGEPNSISKAENISTCMWSMFIWRWWTVDCVITFKDDIVISKTG